MSVIDEALRRVQEQRQQEPQASVLPATPHDEALQSAARPRAAAVASPAAKPAGVTLRSALFGLGLGAALGVVGWLMWVGVSARLLTPAGRAAMPLPAPADGRRSPPFQLTGVVQSAGDAMAIINGSVVRVGDAIDGATLVEIGKDSATVEWRGRTVVLRTAR